MQSSEAIGNGVVTYYFNSWEPAPQWLYWDAPVREYRGPYGSELEAVAVAAQSAETALEG